MAETTARRGLTLTQPWATLVAIGAKRIETRSWPTSYRGPIAIHASKRFPLDDRELCDVEPFASALIQADIEGWWGLPLGAIVAVAHLVECVPTEVLAAHLSAARADEMAFGDYSPGRWGFRLENVRALPAPIPCRGMLGLWMVPCDVAARLPLPVRA